MSSKKLKPFILLSFILGVVYAAFYDFIVRDYVFEYFDYYVTYRYYEMRGSQFILYLIVCATPFVFYKGLQHFSSVLSLFTYIFAYVPMINTLFVAEYPKSVSLPYIDVLFISMVLIFLCDGIVIGKRIMKKNRKRLPFKYLEVLTLVLFSLVILTNLKQLHFVNILFDSSMLYDLREENYNEMNSSLMRYLLGWLKQVFIPLLMIVYLHTKQYLKYAASFGAMILLFMLDMQKLTFLMPFVITIVYFAYRAKPSFFLRKFHVLLLLSMIIFPYLCNTFRDNPVVFEIAFILIFRTQCIEGVEFNTYLRFFDLGGTNPYTWYTHIGIIRKVFGGYPYSGPLGRVVTGGGGNANGVFWLMDGLAAGGVIGIFIITIVFIVFKSLFTSIDYRLDRGLSICVLVFAISSMMNVSLFTALLSCGFLLFYFVVLFFDLDILNSIDN